MLENKKIIGVVGETGSGKNIFCKKIQEKYESVFVISTSLILRDAVAIFVEDENITKQDLQWMALSAFSRFGEDALSNAVKKRIKKSQKDIIIFDGMRMPSDYDIIKSLGGVVVYVTAESKLRWQRIQSRGEKKDDKCSYEKFLEIEKAGTEVNINKIGKNADYKIDNNGTLEEFHLKIESTINDITSKSY